MRSGWTVRAAARFRRAPAGVPTPTRDVDTEHAQPPRGNGVTASRHIPESPCGPAARSRGRARKHPARAQRLHVGAAPATVATRRAGAQTPTRGTNTAGPPAQASVPRPRGGPGTDLQARRRRQEPREGGVACAPHTRPVRNGPSRRRREPAAGRQGLGTGGSGFRGDRGTLLDHVGAMVAEPRARDRHHGIIHFMTVSVVRFVIRILPTEKKRTPVSKKP